MKGPTLVDGAALMRWPAKRAGRKAGPEIRPAAPGPEAGNRNRPVERREGASSPFRPVRTRTEFPRARSSDGTRNPVLSARGYGQGRDSHS